MKTEIYFLDMKQWMDNPPTDHEIALCSQRLSSSRQEKIQSFRHMQGKLLSLGAGLLLDYGLSRYRMRERNVQIGSIGNGKPYLANYPHLHFNLSHSGSMVMAVFSDHNVGCDVEAVTTGREPVAKRFFTNRERQFLAEQTSEAGRTEAFFRIWTLKESVLKVTGEGVRLPIDSFGMILEEPIRMEAAMETGMWAEGIFQPAETYRFLEYRLLETSRAEADSKTEKDFKAEKEPPKIGGYCAAVCLECKSQEEVLERLECSVEHLSMAHPHMDKQGFPML